MSTYKFRRYWAVRVHFFLSSCTNGWNSGCKLVQDRSIHSTAWVYVVKKELSVSHPTSFNTWKNFVLYYYNNCTIKVVYSFDGTFNILYSELNYNAASNSWFEFNGTSLNVYHWNFRRRIKQFSNFLILFCALKSLQQTRRPLPTSSTIFFSKASLSHLFGLFDLLTQYTLYQPAVVEFAAQ